LVDFKEETLTMSEITAKTIERLEELAAWHRINAEHAGSAWVWEARLLTAEDLERHAATLRERLATNGKPRRSQQTGCEILQHRR
jgi:hypothetical protein